MPVLRRDGTGAVSDDSPPAFYARDRVCSGHLARLSSDYYCGSKVDCNCGTIDLKVRRTLKPTCLFCIGAAQNHGDWR